MDSRDIIVFLLIVDAIQHRARLRPVPDFRALFVEGFPFPAGREVEARIGVVSRLRRDEGTRNRLISPGIQCVIAP